MITECTTEEKFTVIVSFFFFFPVSFPFSLLLFWTFLSTIILK